MYSKLREKIDDIDMKLSELFLERMTLCGEVGAVKAKNNGKVTDAAREKAVLEKVTENVPEDMTGYMRSLYGKILMLSKAYQTRSVPIVNKDISLINESLSVVKAFPNKARVACQGESGAYSNICADRMFKIASIMNFKTFENVCSAVDKGMCEFGVLPIENSQAGSIGEVYDLLRKYDCFIVRAMRLKVEHCLLANCEKEDIKTIYSHPQALQQCSEYLSELHAKQVESDNTATSAKSVSENAAGAACVASRECAELYGLKVIDSAIQNAKDNYTRFVCIAKKPILFAPHDKISIMIELPHKPGALNELLSQFALVDLNLTKLESRPNGMFNFVFYCDFQGNINDEKVMKLLDSIAEHAVNFKFLGAYYEA